MGSNGEAVAGAPGTIALGDRVYLVAAASHADLMTVRRRLKKHVKSPLAMYADLVGDPRFRTLPKKVRDDLAREAGQLRMRGEVALSAEMVDDMLSQAEHCRFLAWILLRKLQPDLTLEALTPLIDEDAAPVVYAELIRESGMAELAGAESKN
jgi:hypothetical protein